MKSHSEQIIPDILQVQNLPENIWGGAHPDLYLPGTTTFVLHAPYKPYVSLVGDFNDWDSRALPMLCDGRGRWRITIPHPGATEYGYYVAIDGESHAWVGDPYAKQVKWRDEVPRAYLSDFTEDFHWTDSEWRTPDIRDLTVYELCIRDFAGEWKAGRPHYGSFRRLHSRLDYLVELGVNAVELMPIQAFPGASSWGYNPVFYFAPAEVYGTPDEFKSFVDACHAGGIAVILDVAFNHAWGEHPYYLFYPPMYGRGGQPLTDWNPFFHHTPRAVNMWGGVDWDHFTPSTTRYFQDVVRYWLTEYHVDGFRFDWVCGVDFNSNDPMAPGFDPFHGIGAIAWAARQTKRDCVLIGEYWSLDGTHPEKTPVKLVSETEIDACWHGAFHHVIDDVINQRWQWEKHDIHSAIGGFRDRGYKSAEQVVNYTCSHDEVRPEHELKYYSRRHIRLPSGMTVQEMALRKARLGLVALFAAPGIPMIYAGQEFGEDAPRTIDFCPLEWSKLDADLHKAHASIVSRLIKARNQCPALRSDHILFEDDDFSSTGIVRFHRWDGEGSHACVALNFGDRPQVASLELPRSGAWHEVVANRRFDVKERRIEVEVGPWEGALFTWNATASTGNRPKQI